MPTAALTRVAELLDAEPSIMDTTNGYLDLLGDAPPQQRTLALAAMRSKALPVIYERWWRPAVRLLSGPSGPSHADEHKLAGDFLKLQSGQTVLDVACGPGNFTRSFAPAVGSAGLVVGLDESATMLTKAVQANNPDQVAYVRGDARKLPFADASFDAVGCFLALHLIPEPFQAVREMIRMLKPGARIAIFAPYLPDGFVPRIADRLMNAPLGIRAFHRSEFTDLLIGAGLESVQQQVHGMFQYVGARKT